MTAWFEQGPVSVTVEGAIATVRLERGDRLNAFSVSAMTALKEAALRLREDVATSAIVLTGVPVFTAGADLKDPALAARAAAPLIERREMLRIGPDLCAAWEALDQVTICAIEGFCLGGGVALAVACDFRVCGAGAHLRLPEIPLGMNMSWGSQPRILSLIGPSRAKQLVIFGERVEASQALAWGLVDEVVPDGGTLAAAMVWAEKVTRLPPLGVRMAKRALTQQANALSKLGSFMDGDQYLLASLSEDQQEAFAAFFQRRPGQFSGR